MIYYTKILSRFFLDWVGVIVIVIFALYAAVFTPYNNSPHIRSDGVGYHIWTHAIKSGDFTFKKYQSILSSVIAIAGKYEDGKKYQIKYPPGVALLRLPFMIWVTDPNKTDGFSKAEHTTSQICALISLFLMISVMIYILTKMEINKYIIQLSLIVIIFGTGLFHYSTYDNSFSHIYTAFLVTLLSFSILNQPVKGKNFWIFFSSFFLILVRNTNFFILLFFWLLWIVRKGLKKNLVLILYSGSGLAFASMIQIGINYFYSGNMTLSSYGGESFLWNRPMFFSVLFSYERGLFNYYPIYAIVISAGLISSRSRTLTIIYTSMILFFAGLYGYWHSWFLGGGFGHRGFVDIAPIGIIILAVALNQLKEKQIDFFLLFSCVFLFLTLQLMWGYWQGTIPFDGTSATLYWAHIFGQKQTPTLIVSIFIMVLFYLRFRFVNQKTSMQSKKGVRIMSASPIVR